MPTTELAVTRTVAAPPSDVFDLWMDPARPGGPWFGAARVVLDARSDGLFYVLIEHAGQRWPHYGRFVELSRPHRIEYTWMSEATRGLESVVTVRFAAAGDGTEVHVGHRGLPDDAMGRQHGDGWAFVLSTVAAQFAPRP